MGKTRRNSDDYTRRDGKRSTHAKRRTRDRRAARKLKESARNA